MLSSRLRAAYIAPSIALQSTIFTLKPSSIPPAAFFSTSIMARQQAPAPAPVVQSKVNHSHIQSVQHTRPHAPSSTSDYDTSFPHEVRKYVSPHLPLAVSIGTCHPNDRAHGLSEWLTFAHQISTNIRAHTSPPRHSSDSSTTMP